MATDTAMSKKRKALAAIFTLVPFVSASQELHARWWFPITERQAPNGFSIFILSQNNECLHLLRTYVCLVLDCFTGVASFFPIQLHIPRGYSTKFNMGRIHPGVWPLFLLYTIFDVIIISSTRRSVSSSDKTPRRESKIRRAAEYFRGTSRCFIFWWNTATHVW